MCRYNATMYLYYICIYIFHFYMNPKYEVKILVENTFILPCFFVSFIHTNNVDQMKGVSLLFLNEAVLKRTSQPIVLTMYTRIKLKRLFCIISVITSNDVEYYSR